MRFRPEMQRQFEWSEAKPECHSRCIHVRIQVSIALFPEPPEMERSQCPTNEYARRDDMRTAEDNSWDAIARGLFWALIWVVWQAVRVPVLALLMILEPIVSTLLVAAALLGTLTAIFWKVASNRPDFPFFGVLALSIGCFLLLTLYHAVIRLLSGATIRR